MTPKEKATHLVQKYFDMTDHIIWEEAKGCALIVVSECIKSTQYDAHLKMAHTPIETTEYWIDVKEEIEKL